jgi:nucleoside-diphosphate-sugar epimerase
MRILVTGAGGFVGRALVAALANEAHDVIGIDRVCAGLAHPRIETIEGDFADPAVLARAIGAGCDAVIHLATVPGGAAESDREAAFGVNLTGTAALIDAVCAHGRTRFIFASSIAAFGTPFPATVDDATPLRPTMIYGAHKAMGEQWLATMSRRDELDALSLRLPGILARPRAPSGMKSAFMSDLFHAAKAGESFVAPVSPHATMWLMSRRRLVGNLLHALHLPFGTVGEPYAVTLPPVRTSFEALAGEIARQTGARADLVRYEADAALEAGFGAQPPITTHDADRLGFASDGTLERLVAAALAELETRETI